MQPNNNSNQALILIVEDDPVLARMYSEKFKFEGFNVIVARDGEEALEMALSNAVQLILLDIMLPRMSGIDMLGKLRESPRGKGLNVIVLTNLAEPEEKNKAFQLGVKDYLIKAMQTPEDVVNMVKKYITPPQPAPTS